MARSDLGRISADCLDVLHDAGLTLAVAESCTGGLIAAALTEHAGASRVLDRGFVVYSNDAKEQLLGVPRAMLDTCGAVSEEVARAMAAGVLAVAPVDLAVSVTGIAGPGGATPGKPVGLVHIAAARRGGTMHHVRLILAGGREAIRVDAAERALGLLMHIVEPS